MPEKNNTAEKKGTAKKRVSKGQKLACEVCGLSITIDEIGDEVIEEDRVLICCGKPMKEKKAKVKAAK